MAFEATVPKPLVQQRQGSIGDNPIDDQGLMAERGGQPATRALTGLDETTLRIEFGRLDNRLWFMLA